MESLHPFLLVVPLMSSVYAWYFNTKLFFRKQIPEYYWVVDKVAISGLDLTFYYALAHLLWTIALILLLAKPNNYIINTWVLFGVYDFHGLINLFTVLVSLDTYNEFKEFWYNCIFTLAFNLAFITWIFFLILPQTPWWYLLIWGIIICLVVWVKGMKENIEEEERMMEEMRQAQSGEFPVLDDKRPVIKSRNFNKCFWFD